jgi:hypothetical protein
MILEIVLQLGVFAFGKATLRIIMILALELQAISFYLFNMYPQNAMLYLIIGAFAWGTWSPLYYYMLIEQNTFWMQPRVKKNLYIAFSIFLVWVAYMAIAAILVGFQVVPLSILAINLNLDLVELVYLSLTEFYINYKIYKFSRDKLKSVSPVLWAKVRISLIIFTLCIVLDVIIVVSENVGNPNFAYEVKTCSFAFKIVFECMCFQFIKGIVVSIE